MEEDDFKPVPDESRRFTEMVAPEPVLSGQCFHAGTYYEHGETVEINGQMHQCFAGKWTTGTFEVGEVEAPSDPQS